MKPASSAGATPALPSSPATLTSTSTSSPGRAVPAWRSSWRSADSEATEWISADVRQDLLDLAALQLADEVPRRSGRRGRRLGLEVLGAVLADQRDAGLGERAELLDRRRTWSRRASRRSAGSRPARSAAAAISARTASRFARTRAGSRPWISSATPRPPGGRSRRRRGGGRRTAPGPSRSCRARRRGPLDARGLEPAPRHELEVEPRGRRAPRARGRRTRRAPPRRPRSSSARARADRRRDGVAGAELAQRRHALGDDPRRRARASRRAASPPRPARRGPRAGSRPRARRARRRPRRSPGRPRPRGGARRVRWLAVPEHRRLVHLAALGEALAWECPPGPRGARG